MLICGLAELVSLTSVIPFLVVLTDPDKLNDIEFIGPLVDSIGIENKSILILAITLFFIVATIFTMVVRLLNIRLTGNTSASIGSDLSIRYIQIFSTNHIHGTLILILVIF